MLELKVVLDTYKETYNNVPSAKRLQKRLLKIGDQDEISQKHQEM